MFSALSVIFPAMERSARIFFTTRPIRIIGLAGNPRKIFEFKGLICKIFRGKDLGRSYWPVVAGRERPALHKTTAMKKGAGCSAPFLKVISLLYQFRPTYTDKFCYFIFHANSSTYGENLQHGGLTRFRVGRSGRLVPPAAGLARASFHPRTISGQGRVASYSVLISHPKSSAAPTFSAAREAVPFQNPSNQSFLAALDGASPVSTRVFPQPVKPSPFKTNSNYTSGVGGKAG